MVPFTTTTLFLFEPPLKFERLNVDDVVVDIGVPFCSRDEASMTRLGGFLKLWVKIFATKVALNVW